MGQFRTLPSILIRWRLVPTGPGPTRKTLKSRDLVRVLRSEDTALHAVHRQTRIVPRRTARRIREDTDRGQPYNSVSEAKISMFTCLGPVLSV